MLAAYGAATQRGIEQRAALRRMVQRDFIAEQSRQIVRPAKPTAEAIVAKFKIINIDPDKAAFQGTAKHRILQLCTENNVSASEICSGCRRQWLVDLRQSFIVTIANEFPAISLVRIGKLFGGRDHTTIRHALVKLGCVSRGYPAPKETIAVAG